jgi:hypothetical protein
MKPYENFYKTGFELFQFNPCGLNDVLKDVLENKLKQGFNLVKKYSNTLDLRPNAIEYSEEFLKVLKINNIKNKLRNCTLRDLTLFHIQVRLAESNISYMDWHRDTYYDLDKKIGMTPPGYKIIYYPKFEEEKQSRLKIAVGSHRTMIDIQSEDVKLSARLSTEIVSTNNKQALLFDTSLLHAVIPDIPGNTSIRVIYSFIAKEQLIGTDELHFRTSKMYDEMV